MIFSAFSDVLELSKMVPIGLSSRYLSKHQLFTLLLGSLMQCHNSHSGSFLQDLPFSIFTNLTPFHGFMIISRLTSLTRGLKDSYLSQLQILTSVKRILYIFTLIRFTRSFKMQNHLLFPEARDTTVCSKLFLIQPMVS